VHFGVDASSSASGWGIVDEDGSLLTAGTVISRITFGPVRLMAMADGVREALESALGGTSLRGVKGVVEMPVGFTSGRGASGVRARSAVAKGDVMKCGLAAGAVAAELARAGADVKLVKPQEWKGSWSKAAVLAWTRRTWPNTRFSATSKTGPRSQDAMEGSALAYFSLRGQL